MRLFELIHNTVVVLLHSEKNSLFSHKRAISRQCCIDFVAVSVSAVFFPPLLDFSIDGKLLSQCVQKETTVVPNKVTSKLSQGIILMID